MLWRVVPPLAWRQVVPALRMERIVDPVVTPRSLAAYQQQRFAPGVVDEAVRYAGAGGKRRKVARLHRVDRAVYPCIDFAVENVNELFFLLLRMGPRAALSW